MQRALDSGALTLPNVDGFAPPVLGTGLLLLRAAASVDACHLVKFGNAMLTEVRQPTQCLLAAAAACIGDGRH